MEYIRIGEHNKWQRKKLKRKQLKGPLKKLLKKHQQKQTVRKKHLLRKKNDKSIRDSRKWKELERTFKDEQHNFSSKEKYYQYIDSLMEITVDQKNLLGSFNKFIKNKKG